MNLEASIHQVEAFVREHAAWAPAIVFALAFGESLAFISLLIPAWGALVAIGALIGPGGVSFWPVWIAAALGAALGDWLSYWIGLKLEYTVAHHWPLSRHPDLIPRGEAFVKKWGAFGIFIGRFFGPLRASVRLGPSGPIRRRARCFRNLLQRVETGLCGLGIDAAGGAAADANGAGNLAVD